MIFDFILQTSDVPVTETTALIKMLSKTGLRLLVNLSAVWVLIRFVYYKHYKKRDLFLTYFVFNTIIFLICFLLNKVELSMGAAFGLFAVFSMLRYRTEDISLKDMTYLFLVISIGLISAVTKIKDAGENIEVLFLILLNGFIVALTALLESGLWLKRELTKTVNYERIELIHLSKEKELLEDLKTRTGLNIQRVEVLKIDFLKDTAELKVFYLQ